MDDRAIARGMRPHRHPLDEGSAARLLQGAVHPDDAPPGYGPVAGLLAAAAAGPPVDEDAAAATIAAMVETVRGSAPAPAPARRTTVIGKLFAGKAAIAAALALTAGGAAAATGTLPSPVQGVVSDAVGVVGVEIPHPNRGRSADHRQDGPHRPAGEQPEAGDEQTGPGTDDGEVTTGRTGTTNPIPAAAHDARDAAQESGEQVGPAVCAAVGSNCPAGGTGDRAGDDAPAKPAASDHKPEKPANPSADHSNGRRGGAGDEHRRRPQE